MPYRALFLYYWAAGNRDSVCAKISSLTIKSGGRKNLTDYELHNFSDKYLISQWVILIVREWYYGTLVALSILLTNDNGYSFVC